MIQFPKPAGLLPSVLLLVCALAAARSNAAPVPFVREAAPRTARAQSPISAAPGVLSPLADVARDEAAPSPAPTASDGTWQEFNLLQVAYPIATYDATHDQLLSLGGFPRKENWALSLSGQRAWQQLPAASENILNSSSTTVDPSTGLVYYVYFTTRAEVHTLDPLTGAVTVIPGSELPVGPGGLVFDPVNHRLVMLTSTYDFGAPQVWVLDLLPTPTWSQWLPYGTPPPHDIVYYLGIQGVVDPARRRIVYPFALQTNDGNSTFAIWTLTLDGTPQWQHFETNLLPDTTVSSRNPVVCDAPGDRLVTVGGQGDLFALSLATFQWSATPSRNPGPAPRVAAGIAIDQAGHRLLVCGGSTPSRSDTYSDAWALSLDHAPVWSKLVTDATRAPIRGGASDGYDVSRRRLVVFGGSNELGYFRNDTWLVDLRKDPAWSPLATQGTLPPARYWHVSAWDPVRDQLVVYGGYYGDSSHPLGDLWVLSFGHGTPTWTQIVPAGPAPSARMLTQLVYDSARDRFLLLQGYDGRNPLDDVWELRLTPSPAWRQLAPAGTPPAARAAEMCIYDAARDRVLLFGGSTNYDLFNDLWSLGFGSGDGQWQQLPISPGPSGRNLGLLRFDTTRDRLLLFGGYGVSRVEPGFIYIDYLNDTWALDLSGTPAWRQLSPAGILPWGRDRTNGTYDAAHDRLVLAGGSIDGANDLWTLAFPTGPAAALPASREGRQGVGAARAQIPPLALGMTARATSGRVSFAVQLPTADPATLALFDVAGRSVWSTAVGDLGAGSHEVEMAGPMLQPAIYFARLSQGRATRYARIAVTQ